MCHHLVSFFSFKKYPLGDLIWIIPEQWMLSFPPVPIPQICQIQNKQMHCLDKYAHFNIFYRQVLRSVNILCRINLDMSISGWISNPDVTRSGLGMWHTGKGQTLSSHAMVLIKISPYATGINCYCHKYTLSIRRLVIC